MMRHFVSAQYWGRPVETQDIFFWHLAGRISNCLLDRVLTYKNLIYLLNLQVCIFVYLHIYRCRTQFGLPVCLINSSDVFQPETCPGKWHHTDWLQYGRFHLSTSYQVSSG